MTTGKTSRILIQFAIPMILSGIFQQLYNMVDSIVVGKFDGVNALAAVGASYPITMLFISIAMGGGIGCSVVISQIFGMKQLDRMKTAISTALLAIMAVAAIVMIIGIVYCNDMIRLLGTPSNIFDASAAYLDIYTYGIFFLFIYNITTSIFNGLGDSKTPLYFLVFSSILNIILDIIFVRNLHMSVVGVAWATFIAQGTASVLAFVTLLYRVAQIKTNDKMKYFDRKILWDMTKVALPSIVQFSTVAVGQLMVQALVNSYGAVVIGGYAAAIKIDSFFKVVLQSMSTAISSFTAQNYGAGKKDRIKEGYVSALKMILIYNILSVVVVYLVGDHLIGLFANGDSGQEVINVGLGYMKIVAPFYVSCGFLLLGNGVLRGRGKMLQFTMATGIDLFLRVGLAYLLAAYFGYQSIWWAIGIGWSVGACVATGCYISSCKLNSR